MITMTSTQTASEPLELGKWRILTRQDGNFDGFYTCEDGGKVVWRKVGRPNAATAKTAKAAELKVRKYAEVQASIRDLKNFVPEVVREGSE